MLDNVLTLSEWPLVKQKDEAFAKRRIGLGFTGLGDALMMMQLRYDSPEGRNFASKISEFMRDESYIASTEIAMTKGSFPLFNSEKYLEDGTCASRLPNAIKSMILERGIRNSHLNSIAPTGCVVAGTKVITEHGIINIEDLGDVDGEQWQDLNIKVSTDEGYQDSTKFFLNGNKSTIKVTTFNGQSIQATENHQVRVIDPELGYIWKRMDCLEEGDIMVSILDNYPNIAKSLFVPEKVEEFNNSAQHSGFQNPESFSENIAEMIGFFMANGNIKKDSKDGRSRIIRMYHDSKFECKALNKIVNTLWDEFNVSSKFILGKDQFEDKRKNVDCIEIYSRSLVNWLNLNDCGKNGTININIPNWVMTSPRSVVYAFIRGFFEGDGSIRREGFVATSISYKFLSDLQILMKAVGISTALNVSHKAGSKGSYAKNDVYRLIVGNILDKNRFIDRIGSMHKGKDVFEELKKITRGVSSRIIPSSIREVLHEAFSTTREKLPEVLKNNFQEEVIFDSIVEITEIDELQETYDISVPHNVTYTANNFVTHNTISLAFADNASNGIEPCFSYSYTRKKRLAGGGNTFYEVEDYAFRLYNHIYGKGNEVPEYFTTALSISANDHLLMVAAVAPYIDTAISKTVNIPGDYPYEDFKNLYMDAWNHKIKGIATYRPNVTLGAVLSVTESVKAEEKTTVEATPDINPAFVSIKKRPIGTLKSETSLMQYWTSEGERKIYISISYDEVKGSFNGETFKANRPIEFFFPASQSSGDTQWIAANMRLLSMVARNGGTLSKALENMTEVSWDKGPVRCGFIERADGVKVPRYHDSEVAAIGWYIRNMIIESGYFNADGFEKSVEEIFEDSKSSALKLIEKISDKYKEDKKEVKEKLYKISEPTFASNTGKKCPECKANDLHKIDGCVKCVNCDYMGSCS